jgi:hypothetical protein
MSRRNLSGGKALTEASNLPTIYGRRARAAFGSGPGVPPPLGSANPKSPTRIATSKKHPPGGLTWFGWRASRGGDFRLGGVPKGKWMGNCSVNLLASSALLRVQGSLFSLVGVWGRSPRGKGWAGTPKGGSAQGEGPRTKKPGFLVRSPLNHMSLSFIRLPRATFRETLGLSTLSSIRTHPPVRGWVPPASWGVPGTWGKGLYVLPWNPIKTTSPQVPCRYSSILHHYPSPPATQDSRSGLLYRHSHRIPHPLPSRPPTPVSYVLSFQSSFIYASYP